MTQKVMDIDCSWISFFVTYAKYYKGYRTGEGHKDFFSCLRKKKDKKDQN